MKLPTKPKKGGLCDYESVESFGGTTITLIYAPRNKMIEMSQYRKWIESFGERSDLEKFIVDLWKSLDKELQPMFLQLCVERGGYKINKPAIYAPRYDPSCFQVDEE